MENGKLTRYKDESKQEVRSEMYLPGATILKQGDKEISVQTSVWNKWLFQCATTEERNEWFDEMARIKRVQLRHSDDLPRAPSADSDDLGYSDPGAIAAWLRNQEVPPQDVEAAAAEQTRGTRTNVQKLGGGKKRLRRGLEEESCQMCMEVAKCVWKLPNVSQLKQDILEHF